MRKKKQVPAEEKTKIEFETFYEIGSYELDRLKQNEPSSFNGWVRIKKYKVTVEVVEESKEVLYERLLDLWERCDSFHQIDSLKHEAKKLGYVLDDTRYGIRRKK